MKKVFVFICVIIVISAVTLKAYRGHDEFVSDVILANIEALAEREQDIELPEIDVVCSESCTDGIGKCWKTHSSDPRYCERSPYTSNSCSCAK